MGAAVGAALARTGPVLWASAGRSPATAARASGAGLVDAGTVDAVRDRCELLISICPPEAALDVARQVSGFRGLYLDANAISPATARHVASIVEEGGGRYLDGGIVGAPPSETAPGTRLYLSGPEAGAVAALFSGTAVRAKVLSDGPTTASALKMCYAAWTKGTTALLLDVRALAESLGQNAALVGEWDESMPTLSARSLSAAHQGLAKGWRWRAEMEEIARTFADAGLPDGFHRAAAQVYGALPRDDGAASVPAALEAVVEALQRRHDATGET
ncbi:MAG: DUF1932 domain-containing protein [Acidimicrobiales bacterium]